MLHPQFWEIADYSARLNFYVSLITNGLLIDEKTAQRLTRVGISEVTLSLYSIDPQIHDKMTRRKGSHARTLKAIDHLNIMNIRVGINCLLTNENIGGYFQLEDWAKGRKFPIKFDPIVTPKSNGDLSPTTTRASYEQLVIFYKKLQQRGTLLSPAPIGHDEDPVCNAGRGKCAVNAYGDLLSCLEVREPIGNLKEYTFKELWYSEKAEALRGYKNKDLKFDIACGNSEGSFCDHCPGMAKAETGDAMGAIPFLMDLAKIKNLITSS